MQRRVLRPYPSITVLLEGAYTRTVHRCSYRNIHVELFFAAFFGLCRASTPPQKSGPLTKCTRKEERNKTNLTTIRLVAVNEEGTESLAGIALLLVEIDDKKCPF